MMTDSTSLNRKVIFYSKERTFSTSLVLLTRTKKTKARVTKGQIRTLRRGVRYC